MTTTLIYHGKEAALKNDFSELDSLHVRDLYALDEQDKKKKKDKKSSRKGSSKKSKSSSSKLGDAPAGSELEVLWNRSSTRAEGEGGLMGAPPTPVTRQPSSRVSLLDSRQLEPEGRSLSPPRRHHSGGGNSSSRNGSKLGLRPPPPPPPPLEEPPVARFEFVAKKSQTLRTPYVDESMKDASDMTDVTSQTSGMLDASSPDSRRKSSRGTLRDFSDISGSRGSRRRGVSHLDPPTIATTTPPPSTRMSRKQRMQARASASAGMDSIHGSAPDATGTSTRRAPTAETLRRSNTDQGVIRSVAALPQPTKKIPGKSKSHSPSRPARIGRRHRHHSATTAAQALIMEDQSMPEQQLRKEGAPAFRRANTDEGIQQRLHKESSSSARRTTVEGILYFTAAKEGQPTRRTTIKGRVLPPPPPPPMHSPTQKATKPKATPKRTTSRQRNCDLRREASEASLKSHGSSSKRNNNNEPPQLLHLTNDLLE